MYAYIALSILIGARTEELRALRWDHVDLEGNPTALSISTRHASIRSYAAETASSRSQVRASPPCGVWRLTLAQSVRQRP